MDKNYYININNQLTSDIKRSEEVNLDGFYYLHLHEDDIVLLDSSYRLHRHIANFVKSLSYYFSKTFSSNLAIEEICCCYSYETENSLHYTSCKRNQYFYYSVVSKNDKLSIPKERSDTFKMNTPKNSFLSKLNDYDLIQPYILHGNVKNEVHVEFQPFKVKNKNEELERLLQQFQNEGGYQFSIYGFKFKEGYKNIWLEDKSMLNTLKVAFVRHIISWNSELKQAHKYKFSTEFFARKSAISNVMARGLSHAMGSHILPDYRNYYSTLLGHFVPHQNEIQPIEKFVVKKYETIKEKITPTFLRDTNDHLRHFFNYTQQRMELIADVTMVQEGRTAFDYSLKDVYDNFRVLRESILKGLLDSFDTLNKSVTKEIQLYSNFSPKLSIYIPGGQLGISAFYMILEGFIRNYYKHATIGRTQELYEFLLEISEPEDEVLKLHYYCVDLVDCHGKENKRQRNEQLIKILQNHIDKEILDNRNQLRQGGWGFIEMKAACAYLINFPLEFIENRETGKAIRNKMFGHQIYPNKLLEVAYYKVSSGKKKEIIARKANAKGSYDLGYRFYIKKPKTVLIDKDLLSENQIKEIKELEPKGIFAGNIDKYLKKRSEHELLVTNKEVKTNQMHTKYDFSKLIDFPHLLENKVWGAYNSSLSDKEVKIFTQRSNSFQLDEKHINAVWDSHGKNFDLQNKKLDEIKAIVGELYYHHSSQFNSFLEKKFDRESKILDLKKYSPVLQAKVKDMFVTNISIFDERIQKEVIHPNGNHPQLTIRDTWELCGVFIPPIDKVVSGSKINPYNLDNTERNTLREAIKSRLDSGDTYVVIHYTLFEKLIPKEEKNVNIFYQKLPEYFETPDIHKRIIFNSGIRNPSSIVKDCLFINLSTLSQVIVNHPCKFSLMNILKLL